MNRFFTLLLAASCLTAVGQSEYCLDGTVWDEGLQGCVPESIACEVEFDYDGDGTVGSGDLLAFLTAFGASFPDVDADGVCDDIDECVGEYDECGVCNGPGAVYDCGCEECVEFIECGDPVSYQGYDYETVQIGEQCWFAENLRAENYRNGDAIPAGLSDSEWDDTTSGAITYYGATLTNCSNSSPSINSCDSIQVLNEYGRLYNGYAVIDARALCPSDWHVSTDEDWLTLESELGLTSFELGLVSIYDGQYGYIFGFSERGEDSIVGVQLKSNFGWANGDVGTNISGFSGLPGSCRQADGGTLHNAGYWGFWWSPESDYDSIRRMRGMFSESNGIERANTAASVGMSVRCIRDSE